MKKRILSPGLLIGISCWLLVSCKEKKEPPTLVHNDISHVITQMTDLMVHDITNPPLAARFFSYACLSGYEIVSQNNEQYRSMHGLLNDYPEIKKPDSIQGYNYRLAALLAVIRTASKIQPSGKAFIEYEEKLLDSCRKTGYDEEVIANSQKYAQYIVGQVLAYAAGDRYNKISALPRFQPSDKPGSWYPTPPGYFDAVEPYFNTVRPFTLDSVTEFVIEPPVEFDVRKGSEFYKITEAVYKEGNDQSDEHRAIASFWDCNPFAMQDEGHLMFGFKKISPGSHWMGITGIVCADANKDFDETMRIYTTVAVGLMDAFMVCWDEKYRSNRIRPETIIRQIIDPSWQPLLQTPPFPEYVSGHSVISACSAAVLAHYFGDNTSFRDSVEVSYGLPPRSFTSFTQASEEAAISRFYGGIHYMDAIDRGVVQGRRVAAKVIKRVEGNAAIAGK